jgi:hypothetical protein
MSGAFSSDQPDGGGLVAVIGAAQANDSRAGGHPGGAALSGTLRPARQRLQLLVAYLRLALIVQQRLRPADGGGPVVEVGIEAGEVQPQPPVEQIELGAQLIGNVLVALELRHLGELQRARVEAGQGVAGGGGTVEQDVVVGLPVEARLPAELLLLGDHGEHDIRAGHRGA